MHRQGRDLEMVRAAVSTLPARTAENAAPRAGGPRASDGLAAGLPLEVSLPLDSRAPGAARIVMEGLRGRVSTAVVEDAQLVVSELVTNSVRHSGGPAVEIAVVRVQLTKTMVRLEVENRGHAGVIAARAPDLRAGGGFGLNLVQALSERWGHERFAAGGTRVWAELPCAPFPFQTTTGERPSGRSGRPRKEVND
jgi:anti-sigma regulatory factor (Ser/Thr protein kinase)